jgi:cytoskeletal protein RodZ
VPQNEPVWLVLELLLASVPPGGAMHPFHRAQQTKKKTLLPSMKEDRRVLKSVILFVLIFGGLVGVSTWIFTHQVLYDEPEKSREDLIKTTSSSSDCYNVDENVKYFY